MVGQRRFSWMPESQIPTPTRAGSHDRRDRPALQYALAAAAVAAAALVRLPFEPLLQGRAPYALFFLPILLTAWRGTVGPTLAAAGLSAATAWLFVVPRDEPGHAASLVLFLAASGAMAFLARAARRVHMQAEAALAAARRTRQAANLAVWEWDLRGTGGRSEGLPQLLGLDPADETPPTRQQFRSLIHPDDLPLVDAQTKKAVESGGQFRTEFRVHSPVLGERWLSSIGEVVRDPAGRALHLAAVTLDVTDRKRGEEVEARLAAIVASSEDAIIGKDLNGVVQSCNVAAERLFGHAAEELIGRPITVLIPPDRQEEERLILERLRNGERIEHYETVRLARDGRPIDVSLSISPIRDAAGRIVGASKIVRDVTERKRAAEALAAQREWFRVTLSSIGDAVIAADVEGRVTFMNSVAERLTAWPTSEAQGRPLAEVFHVISEDTRRRLKDPTAKVLETGKVQGLANHTVLVGRDGAEWPVDDSAAPILDDRGKVLGVVLVFHDVIERRRTEAALAEQRAQRERLHESERAARAEAERANRIKDDFVAMVSHELRTPLNAILGWTRLMAQSPDDLEIVRRGLEVVERNTNAQTQLVSDLLDVSRIVSGKLHLEVQDVDLASAVEDAIQTVQTAADARGVQIHRAIDTTLGSMAGDPARLQQAVWNLLSNAIKFSSPRGAVRVTLRRSGTQAEIAVADQGVGIRPEVLPFVFERFRQGEALTTRRFGGLGLGLTIVKQVVELHGGNVQAHSEGEGKGATFTLRFPIAAFGRRPDLRRDEGARTPVAAGGASLESIKVLVVEDEPDTRDLVRRLLEEHRAEVLTAGSAGEALEILASARPDILVSDIGLPEMDGYELMRRIRRLGADSGGRIPAVALTAFARSEDRTRALRAGYQTHLAKPIEPAELVAAVASFADLVASRQKTGPSDSA